MRFVLRAALALFLSLLAGHARAAAGPWATNPQGGLRLISASDGVGHLQTLRLGLQFRLEEGWHIYWRDPGAAGLPPRIDWAGSQNLAAARMLWPAPERFDYAGLKTFGYQGEVVLPLDLVPARAGQPVALTAAVDYLTCKELCIPYHVVLHLDLPAGAATDSPQAPLIARFADRVPAEESGAAGWAAMVAVALLGGLLLNLMPCVLPVLSIKVLHLVSHGGRDRRPVRLNFLSTAAGILTSFWVMAAILAGLKAAGVAVGWGLQFQQPWFIAALALLVAVFAANLWGWFEIPLPAFLANSAVGGEASHFMSGVFTTLLATPCSAPFLGTAIGFALTRGPAEIAAIFTALGLGLAAPHLLIALFPSLATHLPRPGAWMVTLRRVLGFGLAGTALWLVSVLTTQIGLRPASAAMDSPIAWRSFDQAAIADLVSQGQVVFVDVTADWCLTCQVNKRLVLYRQPVATAFKTSRIVAMRADWTAPSAAISRYLAGFGRYGIPFDVVYGPAAPDGLALPELLTQQVVAQAIAKAGGAQFSSPPTPTGEKPS